MTGFGIVVGSFLIASAIETLAKAIESRRHQPTTNDETREP